MPYPVATNEPYGGGLASLFRQPKVKKPKVRPRAPRRPGSSNAIPGGQEYQSQYTGSKGDSSYVPSADVVDWLGR